MVLHAQPADEAAKRADSATFATASPAMSYSSGPLRNPFPPIADYAFLSDCETTCLISPAGAVEWLCVPRPDSRRVLGAMLDRSAGHFRLGPYGVSVPSARRYLPGSLIMETTWQTHTGWLIVRDALVMGPWHDIERRARTHRRTPMDWDAEHILLRTIRCVSGTVELLMSCEPAFDYHRVGATWEYSADGYGEAIAGANKDPDTHPTLRLTTNLRIGLEGREARARCWLPAPPDFPKRHRANAIGTIGMPGCATRHLHCGGSTPWGSTARPTISSRSSPTCLAPTTVKANRYK